MSEPVFLQRILVALDGSYATQQLLAFAQMLARRHDRELVLCTAIDDAAGDTSLLLEASAALSSLGLRCTSVLLPGRSVDAIVTYAELKNFDAIVVGTHGRELLERVALGSTTESVLRRTLLPVFVIHQAPSARAAKVHPVNALGRYLVAVDGSDPSDAALAFALSLAAKSDVLLCCNVVDTGQLVDNTAIYGCDPAPFIRDVRAAARALVEAKTASLATTGRSIEKFVLDGDTATAILDAAVAHGADIIVCGSHGRTGLRRSLIGGVVQALVARSTVPVAVVRRFVTTANSVAPQTPRPVESSA